MTIDWLPADETLRDAFLAWRGGHLDAARAAFLRVLDATPGSVDAWRGAGSVEWSAGNFPASLAAFQRALDLDCYSPMHWTNVGLALRDLGCRTMAVPAFRIALRLDPAYTPAWNEWANVLVDEHHYAEALPLYDRVLTLDTSRAVYFHNRGVCLRLLGRLDDAMHNFHRALALDPGYTFSIEELHRLELGFTRSSLRSTGVVDPRNCRCLRPARPDDADHAATIGTSRSNSRPADQWPRSS